MSSNLPPFSSTSTSSNPLSSNSTTTSNLPSTHSFTHSSIVREAASNNSDHSTINLGIQRNSTSLKRNSKQSLKRISSTSSASSSSHSTEFDSLAEMINKEDIVVNGKKDGGSSNSEKFEGAASIKAKEMMLKLGLDIDGEELENQDIDIPSESEWSAFDSPIQSRSNSGEALSTNVRDHNLLPSKYLHSPIDSPPISQQPSPSTSHSSYSMPSPPLPSSKPPQAPSSSYSYLNRLSNPASTTAKSLPSSDSSSQHHADAHTRHQSLTSACPPATSSEMSPSNSRNGFSLVSKLLNPPSISKGGLGVGQVRKGWNLTDWGNTRSQRLKDPTSPTLSTAPRKLSKSITPISSLSLSSSLSFFDTILSFPSILLFKLIAPLSSPSKSKRSVPLRFFLILYLSFSFFVFSTKTLNWIAGTNSDSFNRLFNRLASRTEGPLILGNPNIGNGNQVENVLAGETRKKEEEDNNPWSRVKRIEGTDVVSGKGLTSLLSVPYRFSKMNSNMKFGQEDEIEPYAFKATSNPSTEDITACLYSNPAWLPNLTPFVKTWLGPISLVYEIPHSRHDPLRSQLLQSIQHLRNTEPLIKKYVDFHLVGTPAAVSKETLQKIRERMIFNPVALNFHSNLARFFAKTDVIFLVGDSRVIPSAGLRRRLRNPSAKSLVFDRGDAIVVPNFGFLRTGRSNSNYLVPNLDELRYKVGLTPTAGIWDGVKEEEFETLAQENLKSLYDSLPIPLTSWPHQKSTLVKQVNQRTSSEDDTTSSTASTLALFDKNWGLNHGPTNWYLWRKFSTDPRLNESPSLGGGIGLGLEGENSIGGGNEVYKVKDYDLHYSPNVVISQRGQPWCTERFDESQLQACVYQMYLSGAELWVLPDEWTFTLQVIEKREGIRMDPRERLKNSIATRLYGKFHQEACMHYGREFLSIQMWDTEKAQHLRSTCASTLRTWGMGQ